MFRNGEVWKLRWHDASWSFPFYESIPTEVLLTTVFTEKIFVEETPAIDIFRLSFENSKDGVREDSGLAKLTPVGLWVLSGC